MAIKNIEDIFMPGNRVLLKVEKIEDKTKGGILLTKEAVQKEQDKVEKGILVKMGSTAFYDMVFDEIDIPKFARIGNMAYIVKYAGKALTIAGEEYRVVNDADIFAFAIEEEEEEAKYE